MKDKIILIQGAMSIEIEYFLSQLKNKRDKTIAGYEFYEGDINNVKVVISKTLIGTINSTTATTIGIINFNPDIVINQGIAGAHRDNLHIGDIIIGERCCNINAYDIPAKNKGEGSNPFKWELNKRAKEIQEANSQLVNKVERNLSSHYPKPIYRGVLGSGDIFNREVDRITWITNLCKTHCEDMESIGTYYVCNKFQVPCIGIRIISNNEIVLEKLDKGKAIELQEIITQILPKL